MGFQLGNIEIVKMYLGNTEITQAYLGNISLPLAQPDIIPPVIGTLSTVVRTNITTATLTWTAASDDIGVTGYEIYRSTEGVDSGFTLLKTVGNVLTTTDTTIVNFDDFYYYYIIALDGASNQSAASNHVSVAALTATEKFPSGTPVSDSTTEGTDLTIFTTGRYTIVIADSTDKQVGTYSSRFESLTTNTQQYRDSFHPATSGKTYVFRWKAKASQTGKSRLRFTGPVLSTWSDIDSLTWTDYEVTLDATSTADIRIYWYSAYTGVDGTEKMWIDDFRMYELD